MVKKRQKSKGKGRYFTSETEQAIIKYNNTVDPLLRSKIFTEEIYFPFYKLAENIIHTFKFYYTDVDDIEDLKHEIVTVLLEEKIDKFDPNNGAKAFSYFGTIVKRWLINYNNKNYKALKRKGDYEELEELSVRIDERKFEEDTVKLSDLVDSFVEDTYQELEDLFPKLDERQIADAVLTLFRTRHDIDIFKKKALYIYIREMTDCKTSHLTKVIKILRDRFYEQYYDVLDTWVIERDK